MDWGKSDLDRSWRVERSSPEVEVTQAARNARWALNKFVECFPPVADLSSLLYKKMRAGMCQIWFMAIDLLSTNVSSRNRPGYEKEQLLGRGACAVWG